MLNYFAIYYRLFCVQKNIEIICKALIICLNKFFRYHTKLIIYRGKAVLIMQKKHKGR